MPSCPPVSCSAPPTTTSTSRPTGSKTDLDLMVEAGFSVIRVGESVWTTWEPEDGRFDLDWLQPVLDGAARARHPVILGTPTYAVPPWLARATRRSPASAATGQRIAVGRPAGDRLHPPGVPVPRRAGHPQDLAPVRRPPGRHRLPGRQRAGHRAAAQPRRLPAVRRRTAPDLRRRRDAERGVGPGLLVAPADHLGGPVDAGRQLAAAVRPGLAGFQAKLTTEFIAWQAGIVREYARTGPVRHHLHRLRAAGGRRRRPDRRRST